MAKNEKFNEEDGVWRTIGGRRVFIKNGQSLSEAMIESGKFKNLRSTYQKSKEKEEKEKQDKEWEEKVEKLEKENAKNKGYELELTDKQKEAGEKLTQNAENGARKDAYQYLNGKVEYDGTKEDFIRDLSNEWGIGREQAEKIVNEQIEDVYALNFGDSSQNYEDTKDVPFETKEKAVAEYRERESEINKKYYDYPKKEWQSSSKNDKGSEEIELTDNNFKNNWQDEIKTKEQLLEKEKEVKEQYKNYKELVAKNNWNSTTVAKNEESYKKTLQNIEDWKKEFDAQEQGFTSKSTSPFYPDKEYSKEDLDRMAENGVKPMKNTYSGSGWEGVNSNKNLSTKEQAKAITDAMKEKYPDVKISRKSDVYSGGSSIHLDIMSSDKDLYVSDADIDKMSLQDLSDVTRSNNFNWWAKENVPGYKENKAMYSEKDVKNYAKERLAQMKKGDNQSVRGDEWYLSNYGKKVVSDLNKEANSYTYDDSDGMTDYFDHGTYMWVNIGKWDKPYQVNQKSTNETMNKAIREKASKKTNSQFEVSDLKAKALASLPKEHIDTHGSDLYIKKTKESDALLENMKNKNSGLLTTFKDQKTGETWYDVPFGNMGDDFKEKSSGSQISNSLREKAYKKYLKEHPGSKISFEQFKDMRKQ